MFVKQSSEFLRTRIKLVGAIDVPRNFNGTFHVKMELLFVSQIAQKRRVTHI